MKLGTSISAFSAVALVLAAAASGQSPEKTRHAKPPARNAATGEPRYALLNINNVTAWLRNDGYSNHSPKGDNGGYFPRGKENVVYQDGFIWGGKAYVDSSHTIPAPFGQIVRAGGATYGAGLLPGRIIGFGKEAIAADPLAPESRIYRIRRDYFTMSEEELRRDAAEVNEIAIDEVTLEQRQAVREQYARDWQEWPVAFGAPYIDRNRNGSYEPPPAFSAIFTADDLIAGGYDEPGISNPEFDQPADQVIWTVCNDLDRATASRFGASEPLGLEAQIRLWAHKTQADWGSYYYRRLRLINKGGVAINESGEKGAFWFDQMYLSQWADGDLGNAGDDLTGCDTLLSLGYFYNGEGDDSKFHQAGLATPAVGYCYLQGARVPADSATAYFEMKKVTGWKNLPMTSFVPWGPGDPYGEPVNSNYENGALIWHRVLRGFVPLPGPQDHYFVFPPGMTPGPFPFSGDPIRRSGHIDGLGMNYSYRSGDRRAVMNTGQFTLAPGDTQEAVVAVIAGMGSDRLSSIKVVKFITTNLRSCYPAPYKFPPTEVEQTHDERPQYYMLSPNYPNPFNAGTRIAYSIPHEAPVKVAIYDLSGREVAVLEDAQKPAGFYEVAWEGRDHAGREVPSGVYFYKLRANFQDLSRKLLLLR